MEVKLFLSAPTTALSELGLSAQDAKSQQLLAQTEVISALKNSIKTTKKEKAEVARHFKSVVPGSDEQTQLIAAMQTVSEKLKQLDEQVKTAEQSLQSLLLDAQPTVAELVPPFITISPQSHFTGTYQVRELTAHEIDAWYEFVSGQEASAYHQPVWADVIQKSFHRPTRIWAAFSPEGKILGGLPLTFFDSKLFGRFAVSVPYFNYGGIVSPWFNVARDLLTHLRQVCLDEKLSHVEVRTMQAELADEASSKKVSMVLALPKTEVLLDEQLGAKVRAQYKKAEEHSPQIRFGKLELLSDFYQVFARNMRDLGTPVYARQWFANILQAPEITAQLAVVYVAKKPVSAGFVVGYRGMLEIPWASTIKEANALNTNMWMYRQILGYAIREGYDFFDFGRSTRDAGTYKFKKQWGAQPYPHYWYTLVPPGTQPPELNPDNPKFKLMIAVWQRLPVWVTRLIGPPIVSNLP